MKICVWPDGEWCDEKEGLGYTKSDDFITLTINDDIEESEIEEIVSACIKKGSC